MLEFLKRLFAKREPTQSTDIDPLTAVALTTDTSSDEPIADEAGSSGEEATASEESFNGGDDFDFD